MNIALIFLMIVFQELPPRTITDIERPDEDAVSSGQQAIRVIAHITRSNGPFMTEIQIANPNPEPKPYFLTAFDVAGTELATYRDVIPAETALFKDAASLFDGLEVSHVTISEDTQVAFSIAYRAKGGQSGPAHIQESVTAARAWRLPREPRGYLGWHCCCQPGYRAHERCRETIGWERG